MGVTPPHLNIAAATGKPRHPPNHVALSAAEGPKPPSGKAATKGQPRNSLPPLHGPTAAWAYQKNPFPLEGGRLGWGGTPATFNIATTTPKPAVWGGGGGRVGGPTPPPPHSTLLQPPQTPSPAKPCRPERSRRAQTPQWESRHNGPAKKSLPPRRGKARKGVPPPQTSKSD